MREFPPLLTAAEMRAADTAAAGKLGLPSLLLMENAGRGVADILRRELAGRPGSRVAIDVTLAAPRGRIQGDAAAMLIALERLGTVSIEDGSNWTEPGRWRDRMSGAAAIVDAIFGIGMRGAATGAAAAALVAMNGAQ